MIVIGFNTLLRFYIYDRETVENYFKIISILVPEAFL